MKEGTERPGTLVDINRLPLGTVESLPDGGLRLGALVSNADTARHPLVAERYPLLASAILAGASPQLRNVATNGGNLNQRTRCYYFYDVGTSCNKRAPGSGCGAIGGVNRIHAILGASPSCIATHPSDMCVALAALDATVQVTGPEGERAIALADYHRLPGDDPARDNTLQPGELVTAIDLPAEDFTANYTYLKLRDRLSYAFALVSVAAALRMEDGRWRRRGSHSAAWRTSRGAGRRRKRCWSAERRRTRRSWRRRTRCWRAPSARATTASKSSWRARRSCGRCGRPRTPRRNRRPTSASRREDTVMNVTTKIGIGSAINRVDGLEKVTGTAKYAAEYAARRHGLRRRGVRHDRQGQHHRDRRARPRAACPALWKC